MSALWWYRALGLAAQLRSDIIPILPVGSFASLNSHQRRTRKLTEWLSLIAPPGPFAQPRRDIAIEDVLPG